MNALTPFNPDSDFDPALDPYHVSNDDIARAGADFQSETRLRVNQGLEADPDDAADAVKLADITGEPAPWVMHNLDDRKEQVRQATAQQLVLSNPALVSYLQSHPMAASVSNDDWANLDQVSEDSSNLARLHKFLNAPFDKIGQAELEGAIEGWQGADFSADYAKYANPQTDPLGTFGALATIGTVGTANLLLKTMGVIFQGGISAAKEAVTEVGGEQAGKAAGELSEWALQRGDVALHEGEGPTGAASARTKQAQGIIASTQHDAFIQQQTALNEAIAKATPWLEAGIEPPVGLHPLIDKAKAQLNDGEVKLLDTALQSVMKANTRERSEELMSSFLDQYHKDARFEIRADAALALYGDKPPALDDGLLGWVPDIDTQLGAARDLNQGVSVKMTDYLANIDPEVHKTLHDDLLMYPGGITTREAAEPPIEPKAVVDAPLAQARDVAGLEPKFAMGDRKLTLAPKFAVGEEDDEYAHLQQASPFTEGMSEANQWARESGTAPKVQGKITLEFAGQHYSLAHIHDVDIIDENGNVVGNMHLALGKDKTIYVDWIGGNAGLWSNSFGPSLVRDIKRQLKAMYPDYDYITGFRVSGARDKAGATGLAKVKLSVPDLVESLNDHEAMQEIFQNGWRRFNERVETNPQGAGFYTPEQLAAGQAAQDEIERIAPGADIQGTAGIRQMGTQRKALGMYSAYADKPPTILYDLLGTDPVGIGRHEAVHYLKDYGFFKPEEWSALESAAKSEGWLDRYGIRDRYGHLDEPDQLEEGIAEAFREWARQAPEVRPTTGIGAIFQKLWDFLDRVRQRMGEALGRTPTWEEVFQRTHEGQVGRRGPGEPAREGAFDLRERYAIEGDDNLRAQAVGLPVDSFRKLQEGYRKRNAEDLEAAIARNKKIEERNQSKEWRSNRADMAKEVAAEIRQRPDIAADAFVGSGELGGKKLQQRFTLRTDDFTPEQRAGMPEHYTSAHGLPADQVAGMFGYGSKDELASALAGVHVLRTSTEGDRMGRRDFLGSLVQTETDRRMELRYGDRDDNVMDAAIDRALSQTNINVMHEELYAQALKSGTTVFDKDLVESTARQRIAEMPLGKVSSYRLMQEMGRFARQAEKAKLDGDDAGMAVAMQRQTLAAVVAKEARAVEKEMKAADKMFRTNYKRVRPSIEPENMNWVHSIMTKIGKSVDRTAADLAREIAASPSSTLEDFVNKAQGRLQLMPVWDQLYDKSWSKSYKDLTVDEFHNVVNSITTIIGNGRNERLLIRKGNVVDFKAFCKDLADALEQFEVLPTEQMEVRSVVGKAIHTGYARTLQMWDPLESTCRHASLSIL